MSDCQPCKKLECSVQDDYEVYSLQDRTFTLSQIEITESPCQPCKRLECIGDDDYELYTLEDRFIEVPGRPSVFNDQVIVVHTCPEGEVLSFTGTLPSWITFDSGTGTFTGSAGTFSGNNKSEANSAAQNALDAFVAAAIADGSLTCASPVLPTIKIEGYFDGMIANTTGSVPTVEPVWNGVFVFQSPDGNWKASNNSVELQMDSHIICNVYVYVESGVWTILVFDDANNILWVGDNGSAVTFLGVYNQTGGTDPGPATLTIVGNPDPVQATVNNQPCFPA